jgi:hypothetical protein
MNGTLTKDDILATFFQLTEIECDACVMTIEEDLEKHGKFGQGYLMAVKQCRDILKRIVEDVNDR